MTKLHSVINDLSAKFKTHATYKKRVKHENYITLVFLGEQSAKKLNLQYRNRPYATDVLSFEGEGLGDLVFCVPILKRQALEHGISFHDELVYLVIHGFLHLLGYDHETSLADEKHMMKLQDDLFERIKKCR